MKLKLGQVRQQKGMSQLELANRSGVAQSTIARLEAHLHEARHATLVAKAMVLEVETNKLIEAEDPAED